jgi:hypothetical protein
VKTETWFTYRWSGDRLKRRSGDWLKRRIVDHHQAPVDSCRLNANGEISLANRSDLYTLYSVYTLKKGLFMILLINKLVIPS